MEPSAESPRGKRNFIGLLSILFFFSGALALIYEVLWQRQFAALFGSSAPATSAILAAYFAGLSAGNFAFGKLARRWARPLFIYGALELAVAAGVLVVAPVLNLYSAAYQETVALFGTHPSLLIAAKTLLGFFAIAIPTVAMGGTLPVLANAVNAEGNRLGVRVGWLYVINTIGAAVGTLAVPVVLLPAFGMRKLLMICAAANAVIGAISVFVGRNRRVVAGRASGDVQRPQEGAPVFFELSFWSGFGIFVLQVLWNRAFAQVHDNSLSAFAWITAVFVLAIASGAEVARLLLKLGKTARNFGLMWLLGGIVTMIAPFIYLRLTHDLAYMPPGSYPFGISGPLFQSALLLIFLPVTLLSTGIPILIQGLSVTKNQTGSEVTGSLLSINTLGCICGALMGGFCLPQWLGLWKSIFAIGIGFVAVGANLAFANEFCSLFYPIRVNAKSLVPRIGAVVLLAFMLRIELPNTFLGRSESLLALKEGPYGIAAVIERKDGSRRLKLNNHYVLGGTLSTGDQRMQAHIPLLLGPNGGRVAFLGYGTGITAGGALFHPNFQPTAVELVPEVAQLASIFFAEVNGKFASTAPAKVILEDARNYLRGTREEFDVIVGDLVVPWRPGESSLYTIEHFQAVRTSLTEQGIFCAWVPMFQVNEPQFEIILRTFLEVFGHAYIWRGDFSPIQPAYGLVAFKTGEEKLNPLNVANALKAMRADRQNPHLSAIAGFWLHFVGRAGSEDLARPLPVINSEDKPWLELGYHQFDTQSSPPFVGRRLQPWENRVRERSRSLVANFPADARTGWEAGGQMVQYTQLLFEGKTQEAAVIESQIREHLGEPLSQLLFGR